MLVFLILKPYGVQHLAARVQCLRFRKSKDKMIAAEFQLTSDDYAEAQLDHFTKVQAKKLILYILVLGAALVGFLLIALTDPARRDQMVPAWIFLGIVLLFWILLRSKVFYRMQFNRTKALHGPIHFEASDGGVVFRSPRGESTTKWEGLEKWRESKGSFLLYTQPRLFFVVPKRVLDIDQVTALRELLSRRMQ